MLANSVGVGFTGRNMNESNVFDVGAYFAQKANIKRSPRDFTPLKLQKILYYAQGWYLADKNKPLFDSPIYAWKYGPVVQKVYDYYKGRPTAHITVDEVPGNPDNLDVAEKKFLDAIWGQYGKKSAWELVGMTHVTQPWIEAFADPISDVIDNDEIRDYFLNQKI
jgi:uncharacterized phage-associated protein